MNQRINLQLEATVRNPSLKATATIMLSIEEKVSHTFFFLLDNVVLMTHKATIE